MGHVYSLSWTVKRDARLAGYRVHQLSCGTAHSVMVAELRSKVEGDGRVLL